MKLLVLLIPMIASTLSAQTSTAVQIAANSCGPFDATYKVTTADTGSAIPAPASGMATLVFVEDQIQDRPGHHNESCIKCASQVRLGMDGQWVAVTQGFSHITVSVEPGDHHFCAVGAGSTLAEPPLRSHYGLNVEAGKTYFLSGRLTYHGDQVTTLDLSLMNEDEGRYLVAVTKQSTFTKK